MLSYEFIKAFAKMRNDGISFSFLKENGELLSIAVNTSTTIDPKSLELYTELYENALNFCKLYPQFFRFILAIVLDLEVLGMPGNQGEVLSDYVLKNDLYAYEVSDTRRLEIINLLARTGRSPNFHTDPIENLETRVSGFFGDPDRFIKFNKPLFYDLTHIVFFWTNYGKSKISKPTGLIESLTHVGLLAFLDNDADLLSEVCLCLNYLDSDIPAIWQNACKNALNDIKIEHQDPKTRQGMPLSDEYHIYFMINCLLRTTGDAAFIDTFEDAVPVFSVAQKPTSALAAISHKLHLTLLTRAENKLIMPVNHKTFLSEAQCTRVEQAFSSTPLAQEFFSKLTHGSIT